MINGRRDSTDMVPIRHGFLARVLLAVALLVPVAAQLLPVEALAALPVRIMPPYRVRGDVIDDPVQLKSDRKAFEAAYESYRVAAKEYRDEVREFIAKEVGTRQKNVSASYQGQIDAMESAQFDLRRDAIARLESFIFRHRDHDQYTPDTMFRLAELYYEDTIASYNRSQDNYSRELDLYNRGKLLDPPSDSDRDFSRSIAIYKYLHWVPEGTRMDPLSGKLEGLVLDKRWPKYKFADAAMYLQGYCEFEGGDAGKAITTLSAIEEHYPNSGYIAEAWLRVGEMHFDDSEFEAAANAYGRAASRALATNDTKNYALALYKLGWSNFQLYKYPEAVRWFQKLIEFEDTQSAKAGPGDKKNQLDLRKEAIEYLAKSLAEPSWDDDGCDDFGNEDSKTTCLTLHPRLRPRLYVASVLPPRFDDFPNWQAGIQGEPLTRLQAAFNGREAVRKDLINGKPYVYDILVTYGNTLYEQAVDDYYRQAVLVMGYTIDTYPIAREAQGMQRKVIRSVDILAAAAVSYTKLLEKNPNDATAKLGLIMALEDQERQVHERRKYLTMFAKGSAWYEKWGGDKDLAAQVDETVGRVRMDFAQLTHMQAQTLRASGDEEAALAKYAEAAREYEVLLRADMEAPGAYKLAWTLSETLFFAGKRCDALRDKDNNLLRMPIEVKKDDGKFETRNEGELVTYPADATVGLKKACDQMKKSVEYYTLVRDWKGQRTRDPEGKPMDFAEQAGFSAILASSLVLNARAAYPLKDPEHLETRMLPELRPSAAQDEADVEANEKSDVVVRVVRRPIDAVAVDWLLAVDGYIAANQFNPKDPERPQRLALQAAELLFKNRNFDPWLEGVTPRTTAEFWSARERFWWLMKKYPTSAQAAESFKNMLTSYNIERDFKKLQEVAEYGDKANIGPPEERKKIKAAVEGFELGALGKGAQAIFDKADTTIKAAGTNPNPDDAGKQFAEARKTYEESGDLFRSLRAKSPETKVQMAALMNGMRAFYRAEKWEKCFEVLKEAEEMVRAAKPTGPKEKEEKEENLKRLDLIVETRANLNFQFFNVPEAIADFRILHETNPTGPKAADYLRTAADLAEKNGNWDLTIQLDRDYISKYQGATDTKKKDQVLKAAWRIQQSFQRKGDINKQIESLEEFITRYESNRQYSGKVFQSYSMIAEIYETRGDKKNTDRMYKRIIDAFTKGAYEKNGGPEATAAAQSTFMLMKPRYEAFLATKLVENTKLPPAKRALDLQKQVLAMMDITFGPEKTVKKPDGTPETARGNGMYDEYANAVATFGSQNWSYAAFLYRAKMLQYFARTIYGAPVPENMSEDEQAAYEEILESFGKPIEDRAMKSLEIALKDAESKGVVNQWVTELRKAINQYKPGDYPLLKDEKRLVADPAGNLPQPDKELR